MDFETAKRYLKNAKMSNFELCTTPRQAVRRLCGLYEATNDRTLQGIKALRHKKKLNKLPTPAYYPFVALPVAEGPTKTSEGQSYGWCRVSNRLHIATVTRPDIFASYWEEQLTRIMDAHSLPVLVGTSNEMIPLEYLVSLKEVPPELRSRVPRVKADIVGDLNGTDAIRYPLAWHSGTQIDLRLRNLHRYTGTPVEHFQRVILLTNYRIYLGDFLKWAEHMVAQSSEYKGIVEPEVLKKNPHPYQEKLPQMPALHLTREDGNGVTIIDIGVSGPNAANIMDSLAALRPHLVLMVGHAGGAREKQRKGNYVLADNYVRCDGIFDRQDPPATNPSPVIDEVNGALIEAVLKEHQLDASKQKSILEIGTVASTSFRPWPWESCPPWVHVPYTPIREVILNASALAVDMETTVIAAMGKFWRIPTGTLLRLTDLPLDGEQKDIESEEEFYVKFAGAHLRIALEAVTALRETGLDRLHSRRLRGRKDPAFR